MPFKLIKYSGLAFIVLFLINQAINYFVTGCTDGALRWYDCIFYGYDVSLEMTLWTWVSGSVFLVIIVMFFLGVTSYAMEKILKK
jgi:hypothetical protein